MSASMEFLRGARYFDEGRFFEAHDVWEELWMETTGRARVFYQGMIQAAIAYYHASNNNAKGAAHLMTRSIEKLEQCTPSLEGVDLDALLPALRAHELQFLRALDGGTISLPTDCPKLDL
jgi:uncharacterized protein